MNIFLRLMDYRYKMIDKKETMLLFMTFYSKEWKFMMIIHGKGDKVNVFYISGAEDGYFKT